MAQQSYQALNQFEQSSINYASMKKKSVQYPSTQARPVMPITKNQTGNQVQKVQKPKNMYIENDEQIKILKSDSSIKFGQFSKFAYQSQTSLYKNQQIIKGVIKQAYLSYQKRLQKINENLKQMQTGQQDFKRLGFSTQQKLLQFIKDPVNSKLQDVMNDYLKKRYQLRYSAFIDGKVKKIQDLKIQQSFKHNGSLYVPSINPKQFIKIQSNGVVTKLSPARVFQGKFLTKTDFHNIKQQSLRIINDMVILFLRNQGMIVNQQSILQKIKKLAQ